MNEEKKVPFKWEYGEETISLQLGMYANNQRLYIGMITHTEDTVPRLSEFMKQSKNENLLCMGILIVQKIQYLRI